MNKEKKVNKDDKVNEDHEEDLEHQDNQEILLEGLSTLDGEEQPVLT